MPKGKIPNQYQYKADDNPLKLSEMYGTTPDQLFNANPGGTPFSIGQTINIPKPPVPNAIIPFKPPQPSAPTNGPFPVTSSPFQIQKQPKLPSGGSLRTAEVPRNDTQAAAEIYRNMFNNAAQQYDLFGEVDPSILPQEISSNTQLTLGKSAAQMQAMGYTFDNGTWRIGSNNTAASLPNRGQYVDNTGNVKQGATPFGTNSQGQRLDVNGNVFDPQTATRDIYGGVFRQPGEKRFRKVGGKVIQEVLTKDGWVKKKATNKPAAAAPQSSDNTTGFQQTSFGVGSG